MQLSPKPAWFSTWPPPLHFHHILIQERRRTVENDFAVCRFAHTVSFKERASCAAVRHCQTMRVKTIASLPPLRCCFKHFTMFHVCIVKIRAIKRKSETLGLSSWCRSPFSTVFYRLCKPCGKKRMVPNRSPPFSAVLARNRSPPFPFKAVALPTCMCNI